MIKRVGGKIKSGKSMTDLKYVQIYKGYINPFMTEADIKQKLETIDLWSKSMDWFLYDIGLRHERVNGIFPFEVRLHRWREI